jgi:V/A-type H+-transporting ATPase subunit K
MTLSFISLFSTVLAQAADVAPSIGITGFNWSQFLGFLGLGLLGLGLSGSAIGLAIAGSAVAGMRPERRNLGLVVSVLPGTQGLYSFAVGFLCMNKLTAAAPESMYLKVFAAGTITGIACLVSGWYQGVVCAAGIKSINQDKMGVGNALLLAVFPEFYAILSFAFAMLLIR